MGEIPQRSTSPKEPLGTFLLLAIESSGYSDAVRSRRKYTLSEKSNNSHLPIFRNSKASVFTRDFEEIFQVWNFEEVLSSEAVISDVGYDETIAMKVETPA